MKLDTLARFDGRSRFSNGVENRSGLGLGEPDGVAEALKPGFGKEEPEGIIAGRGMLTERASIRGLEGSEGRFFLSFISCKARFLTSGATREHFDRCGTIDWLGFPAIGVQSLSATKIL